MYLEKNSLFFGYSAVLMRDVFCKLPEFADVKYFSRQLGIDEEQAAELVDTLIKEGYLEWETFGGSNTLSKTIKGNSLAMASFAPPITRKTADKKIAELIERAKIVNTSNEFLYKVKRIAVFGSYLSDKDRINDIDIDIVLEKKFPKEIQKKKEDEFIKKAMRKGKEFGNFIDRLFYPMTYTKNFLKHRSRAFSLHYEDQILEQTEYKIIYELNE